MKTIKPSHTGSRKKKVTSLAAGCIVLLTVVFASFGWTYKDIEIKTDSAKVDSLSDGKDVFIIDPSKMDPPQSPESLKYYNAAIQSAFERGVKPGRTVFIRKNISEADRKKIMEREYGGEENEFCKKPDVEPEFPGGWDSLKLYLQENVKYPSEAQKSGAHGRVLVIIAVNIDGSITVLGLKQKIDPYLDKEALRVVESMPKWTPGMKSGKPVRVATLIPISFKLEPKNKAAN